jgi:hypothetical protein
MEPSLSILVTLIRTIIVNKDLTFMQRCLVTAEKQVIDKIRTVGAVKKKRRHRLPEGTPAGAEHTRPNCCTGGQQRQHQQDHIFRERAQAVLAIRHNLFLAIQVANWLCHFVKQVSCTVGGPRVSEISYQEGKMEKKILKIRPALRRVPLLAASGRRAEGPSAPTPRRDSFSDREVRPPLGHLDSWLVGKRMATGVRIADIYHHLITASPRLLSDPSAFIPAITRSPRAGKRGIHALFPTFFFNLR